MEKQFGKRYNWAPQQNMMLAAVPGLVAAGFSSHCGLVAEDTGSHCSPCHRSRCSQPLWVQALMVDTGSHSGPGSTGEKADSCSGQAPQQQMSAAALSPGLTDEDAGSQSRHWLLGSALHGGAWSLAD